MPSSSADSWQLDRTADTASGADIVATAPARRFSFCAPRRTDIQARFHAIALSRTLLSQPPTHLAEQLSGLSTRIRTTTATLEHYTLRYSAFCCFAACAMSPFCAIPHARHAATAGSPSPLLPSSRHSTRRCRARYAQPFAHFLYATLRRCAAPLAPPAPPLPVPFFSLHHTAALLVAGRLPPLDCHGDLLFHCAPPRFFAYGAAFPSVVCRLLGPASAHAAAAAAPRTRASPPPRAPHWRYLPGAPLPA